jgi:hypothetical protein
MTSAALVLAAETEHHVNELPMEPWVMGVGTFLLLCVLLAITLSFNRGR